MNRKHLLIYIGVFVGVYALLMGGYFLLRMHGAVLAEHPPLYRAPEFEMTDAREKKMTRADLLGKIWIADFFFTSCGGPCPAMTAAMAGLARHYADAPELRFVSFTVDPDTDTPERLAEYAKKFNADLDRWHFLTGGLEQVQRIAAEGFKLGSLDAPIVHSEKFVVVDREGMIRGYFDGTSAEGMAALKRLVDALR